jgi:hypothetical protein
LERPAFLGWWEKRQFEYVLEWAKIRHRAWRQAKVLAVVLAGWVWLAFYWYRQDYVIDWKVGVFMLLAVWAAVIGWAIFRGLPEGVSSVVSYLAGRVWRWQSLCLPDKQFLKDARKLVKFFAMSAKDLSQETPLSLSDKAAPKLVDQARAFYVSELISIHGAITSEGRRILKQLVKKHAMLGRFGIPLDPVPSIMKKGMEKACDKSPSMRLAAG